MNKKVYGRKLGRSRPAREALFSSLVKSMIISGKIVTTRAKAKAIQGDLEKMVSLSKKGDTSARSRANAYLDNAREVTNILFNDVSRAFANRTSGFTRLINLPNRRGDNSKVVRIEWTEKVELKPKAKVEKKKTVKKAKEVKKAEKPAKKVVAKKAEKKTK